MPISSQRQPPGPFRRPRTRRRRAGEAVGDGGEAGFPLHRLFVPLHPLRLHSLFLFFIFVAVAACGDDGGTTTPEDGPGGATEGDATPPTVVSTVPADGARGADLTDPVTVTFSEPVVLPDDSASPVDVRREGRDVPGEVERTGPAVLTFSARYPLDPGGSYRAVLPGASVADTAGNALAATHAWSFRTEGAELPGLAAADLLHHVRVLAHDSMRGRDAGSPEELQAARYVRDRFRDIGLEPGAPDYLQTFPLSGGGGDLESQNVIGVLPGRGQLADEWLVVGAHYDHVGVVDGQIYNGADDNASGTAVLLGLARGLAEHVAADGLGGEDRRSVMFHGYGAEEAGLVGSNHFCSHPTEPMSTIVAMMNMDMVGRLRSRQLDVIGPSLDTPLGRLVAHVNRTGLTLVFDTSLLDRSDQRCFLDHGKPVAFLHTGLHAHYHQAGDDVERIREEGMAAVGDLALRTLVKLMLAPGEVEAW